MKKFLLIALLAAVCSSLPLELRAESWIFRPSYYSHDPTTNVRIGRQYAGGPAFTRPTGSYVSGGLHWTNNRITIRGQIYDNYQAWEAWYQQGGQY